MKRYIKIIDGLTVIKPANRIVIRNGEAQTINPTEEMILADGWEEYVEPEPSDYDKLVVAKRDKKFEVERYDDSDDINEFYVSDQPIRLDKVTRVGLLLRFQAEQEQGATDTTLWYEGRQFPLKVDKAIQMLYAIERYASACYDNTQRHLATIQSLKTIEEVEAYDYTTGYPERLRF